MIIRSDYLHFEIFLRALDFSRYASLMALSEAF